VEVSRKIREIGRKGDRFQHGTESFNGLYNQERVLCPLNSQSRCKLYQFRPIRCRVYAVPDQLLDLTMAENTLSIISQNIFLAFSGSLVDKGTLSFSMADTVSGKFVQEYFNFLVYLSSNM
jgi:hypothetical protein